MNKRVLLHYKSPFFRDLARDNLRQQFLACPLSLDIMIPDANDRFPCTIERYIQVKIPFKLSSAASVAMALAMSIASFTG